MSHRQAYFLQVGVLLLFLAPVLFQGQVIFPHDNRLELGTEETAASGRLSNRKFSDVSSVYVPETHLHLSGDHRSWLATWNPHVEMGRPAFHIQGFSKAFLLTHLASFITQNPFVLHTWSSVLGVLLLGSFGYLFLRSLNLRPESCFAGSVGLALGVFVTYWLTFPMYIWPFAWTVALLWLIPRSKETLLTRATVTAGLTISFVVYAMLMTGYPQLIIWHVWLVAGFTVVHVTRRARSWSAALALASKLTIPVLVGAACAAPVYADLLVNTARSARVGIDAGYFTDVLPVKEGWQQLVLFLVQVFDAFWFGNPIEPTYPFGFQGLCLTPLFSVLVAISFLDGQPRRLWPWQVFLGICMVMTVWPAAYVFGVRFLGLGFSSVIPVAAAYVPVFVLVASAIDHILEGRLRRPGLVIGLMTGAVTVAAIGLLALNHPVNVAFLAMSMLIFGGVLSFVSTRRSLLLVVVVIASVLHYSARLRLIRPEAEIQQSSALVAAIKSATDQDGSRFAWVYERLERIIPANQETLYGLRSIHTYNSLSARLYQAWTLRLDERGTQAYGRHFRRIVSDARLVSLIFDFFKKSLVIWGHRGLERCAVRTASPSRGSRRLFSST